MDLNLSEAIRHCEEVAEANEKTCEAKPNVNLSQHQKCAEEHRQLAEWLKELQWYRNCAGVLFHEGKTYVNGAPIIKTIDKNGMCSFYGFKEVKENDRRKENDNGRS